MCRRQQSPTQTASQGTAQRPPAGDSPSAFCVYFCAFVQLLKFPLLGEARRACPEQCNRMPVDAFQSNAGIECGGQSWTRAPWGHHAPWLSAKPRAEH